MSPSNKKVFLLLPPDPNSIEPFKSAPQRQFPMGIGFPMGLGYIASYLREQGQYEICLFDALHRRSTLEEVMKAIEEFDPAYIGMTVFTVNSKVAVEMARQIKARWGNTKTVIVGGPHASEDYENLLTKYPYFDFIVRGEGEKTALNLLRALDLGAVQTLPEIPGIAYRDPATKTIVATKAAELTENLDEYSFPARDLVDFDSYIQRETTLPYQVLLMSSRGCTHRCAFCSFQKKWRARCADNVIQEIKHIIATYPRAKSLAFLDDDFSANKQRVIDFCQKMIAEGMDQYKWSCSCRVDQVDLEVLTWMKKAGCIKILYGLESGDPEILKTIRKKIDLNMVEQSVNLTAKVGIPVIVFVIAGNPGETLESLKRTYDFVKKLKCEAVSWGVMQVYPGTALSKMRPPVDFVSYLYEPEVQNPSAAIHANVVAFENPGLDREALKVHQRKLARNTILFKMARHPDYALKKLYNMPRAAVTNFLWLLGVTREP